MHGLRRGGYAALMQAHLGSVDGDNDPDMNMEWVESPNWLRPSRTRTFWVDLRIHLNRSIALPAPRGVAHNYPLAGPRRLIHRLMNKGT